MTFATLRQTHPEWLFESFSARVTKHNLEIGYVFKLGDQVFEPKLTIHEVPVGTAAWIKTPEAQAYLLNLGMIELVSYWKATCSPVVMIEAGYLDSAQLAWWKDVWRLGLGEFWLKNQIDPTQPDLLEFKVSASRALASKSVKGANSHFGPSPKKLLIPVGGGKDSAALLGWLADQKIGFGVLLLEPHSPAAAAVANLSQTRETIRVTRQLDPQLKDLNAAGYLNGHTPFSALLGWVSVLVAKIFNYEQVAVANEQSANEGNSIYHGLTINHQYSKTTDYEVKFRDYLAKYLQPLASGGDQPAPNYFSIWRPLHEVQIAQIFSRYQHFFPVFRSCNVGQQRNEWCHKCPKCVFVYSLLAPVLAPKTLQGVVFSHDLFDDIELLPIWLQLLGFQANKPFECVGTAQEILVSIQTYIEQLTAKNLPFPKVVAALLAEPEIAASLAAAPPLKQLLSDFAAPYFLPENLAEKLIATFEPITKLEITTTQLQNWRSHPAVKKFAGRKIALIGLGREGLTSYHWFRQVFPGQKLTLADKKSLDQLDPEWLNVLASDPLARFVTGPEFLSSAVLDQDYLFMTPGIRTDQPEILASLESGAQLQSQTQLFFELCPSQIIGVTGTKGKSTTSSLIHHVLAKNGIPAVLVGNIGTPMLDQLAKIDTETLVVAELSCHQLQHLTISPHIAVIQNITSEHLDYYPTTADYVAAKSAIARFQTSADRVIFQRSHLVAAETAALGQAQAYTYRIDPDQANQSDLVWLDQDHIWLKTSGQQTEQSVIKTTEIPLLGHHNLYNVAPAVIIGHQLGLSTDQISTSIQSFQSLPHRLELVLAKDNLAFYDDSLSTTPEATIAALEGFGTKPIVLIAGGHERHQDFSDLAAALIKARIIGLVLLPTTGERLKTKYLKLADHQNLPADRRPQIKLVETMAEAVAEAKKIAQNFGSTAPSSTLPPELKIILMSPASASFNGFKDYHDRGEQFAAAART